MLILTAFDDPPYVKATLQAGANGYLLKTAEAAEIVAAIQSVRVGQSVLDKVVAHRLMEQMATPQAEAQIEALTARELEGLHLTARGFTN